jgi:hypothetical protein
LKEQSRQLPLPPLECPHDQGKARLIHASTPPPGIDSNFGTRAPRCTEWHVEEPEDDAHIDQEVASRCCARRTTCACQLGASRSATVRRTVSPYHGRALCMCRPSPRTTTSGGPAHERHPDRFAQC